MAKKNMGRDLSTPLARTFGDPPRKYTASDSVSFHDKQKVLTGEKKVMQGEFELHTRGNDPQGVGFVKSSNKVRQIEGQLRANPYSDTYTKRTGDKLKTFVSDTPQSSKTRQNSNTIVSPNTGKTYKKTKTKDGKVFYKKSK